MTTSLLSTVEDGRSTFPGPSEKCFLLRSHWRFGIWTMVDGVVIAEAVISTRMLSGLRMSRFSRDVSCGTSGSRLRRTLPPASLVSTFRNHSLLLSVMWSGRTLLVRCNTSFFDPVTTEDTTSEMAIPGTWSQIYDRYKTPSSNQQGLDDGIVCAAGNSGLTCVASWGWSRSQGLGCSPIKAARELGLERRETVDIRAVYKFGQMLGTPRIRRY